MTQMQRLRPIHWDEVVGQEHVKDVLQPALERGRIGHAYLFSGPRGVGKTTTARLIAMTVTCEVAGVKPCGQCDSCKSVIAGRHPDVLEIDAASNNSVDDVRDLREKVALQPMRGTKKVYILDEAHMMSKSAFNALLKTLEEPPSHAVFVLATTEPERLPPTILSRCQHYRFRRLSSDEIAGKLLKTATAEGVNASPAALQLIARASDGAMRDGESLLEQLLAAGEPNITLEMVEGALGLPPQDRIEALGLALARGDTKRVMQNLNTFYADGFAPRTITERVKIALRDQLHAQLGLSKNVSETFGEAHLLKLIRALDEEDARFARASDLISLEMAFTKAMLAPDEVGEGGAVSPALESRVSNLEKQVRGAFQKVVDEGLRASGQRPASNPIPDFDPTARSPRRPVAPPPDDEAPFEAPPPREAVVPPREPSRTGSTSAALDGKGWADVILKANLRFRAILKEAKGYLSADTLVIEYSSPKHKWHAEQVAGKLEELATLTQQVIGQNISLELVMPDGTKKNSRQNHNLNANQPAARVAPVVETAAKLLEEIQESVLPESMLSAPIASQPVASASQPMTEPPILTSKMESELAFAALGSSHPKAGLFSPAEFVAALEPDALSAFEPAQTALEKTEFTNLKEIEFASLEPETLSDDSPPFPTDYASLEPTEYAALETFDLESSSDSAPLAALEMDFGDLDSVPTAKPVVSSLAGHPNYALLSKLFAHRVREVGRLEVQVPPSEENTVIPALPVEEAE